MLKRCWLVSLIIALASCTDPALDRVPDDPAPEPTPAAEVAARRWECVSVCLPGDPCRNLCLLTIDDPGFQIVDGPFTCDSLRPINVCGDGCCDPAESIRRGEAYCPKDCRKLQLEVYELDGKLAIANRDKIVGFVEPGYVSIEPVCR